MNTPKNYKFNINQTKNQLRDLFNSYSLFHQNVDIFNSYLPVVKFYWKERLQRKLDWLINSRESHTRVDDTVQSTESVSPAPEVSVISQPGQSYLIRRRVF